MSKTTVYAAPRYTHLTSSFAIIFIIIIIKKIPADSEWPNLKQTHKTQMPNASHASKITKSRER